ncbi:unnamed protein product [Bursaphelenchus xylophilus]|uniref:(pine wood nematode) hypothetical protein n=1 Tax=Bursaphelenchus xylophilus TaxID=6326 RepID=A0A7I8WI24_BURXY|nr:unnamed protein product [Bursaphelenchus xylophilus]CAG9109134.1 unnamed protein product [Bursaphelenchus xylophilus]
MENSEKTPRTTKTNGRTHENLTSSRIIAAYFQRGRYRKKHVGFLHLLTGAHEERNRPRSKKEGRGQNAAADAPRGVRIFYFMRDDEMWRPIAVGSSSMRRDEVTSDAGSRCSKCNQEEQSDVELELEVPTSSRRLAGTRCEYCSGRVQLNNTEGNITSSLGKYPPSANCLWLIDGTVNGSLHLEFLEFETENYWDHLYIYDGNFADDNLIAALSGKQKGRQLIVPSGKAILYFTSDIAINHPGFSIRYKYNTCLYNCSGHGTCDRGVCKCNDGHSGQACEQSFCHKNHNPCLNGGSCIDGVCSCPPNRHGQFCQAIKTEPVWDRLVITEANKNIFHPRASHTAVNVDGVIYICGGYTFSKHGVVDLVKFDSKTEKYTALNPEGDKPLMRSDHSMVYYAGSFFIFGGVVSDGTYGTNITNELWQYEIKSNRWYKFGDYRSNPDSAPYAVAGHTAHVYGDKMYIVFGYNPYHGYLPYVQICDLKDKSWANPMEKGGVDPKVIGRFGHSSVLLTSSDGKNAQILVLGGSLHVPNGASSVTDEFLSYNVQSDAWTILPSFDSPRFRHSSVLVDGMMISFGGNSPGDSQAHENGDRSSLLIYDTTCKKWDEMKLDEPESTYRYGHAAVTVDVEEGDQKVTKVYVIGGFDGLMKNDILVLTLAKDCSSEASSVSECYNIAKGIRCSMSGKKCQRLKSDVSYLQPFAQFIKSNSPRIQAVTCPDSENSLQLEEEMCSFIKDCTKCVSRPTCGWCSSTEQCQTTSSVCLDELQTDQRMCSTPLMVKASTPVEKEKRPCSMNSNCFSCHAYNCAWMDEKCVSRAEQAMMITEQLRRYSDRYNSFTVGHTESVSSVKSRKGGLPFPHYNSFHEQRFGISQYSNCSAPCSDYRDCKKCVDNNCMWCPTVPRCIAMDTYMVNLPYGQCQSWVTSNNNHQRSCELNPLDCSAQRNATDCQLVGPRCGWCDSGDGTGIGECLEAKNDKQPVNEKQCNPAEGKKFYFTGQPECQCNGHSTCVDSTHKPAFMDVVLLNEAHTLKRCASCSNNTKGDHCEFCEDGYYGDPRNGGVCKKCMCNDQAETCDEDGTCNCIVKGATDKACDQCDFKYHGDPKHGTPCAFELLIDFIYTFKLDADDPKDKYVKRIHFKSIPFKRDIDVQFTASCEGDSNATLLVDLYYNKPENSTKRTLYNDSCVAEGLKRTYSANDFHFGAGSNTTFGVSISNFKTPIKIQISFAQSPPINWVLFFVIFAACFIVLLVVAGILLLIKQRIRNAGQEANIIIENERMAARPKKSVQLHLPEVRQNVQPTPIAIEPCKNLNTAIYTVVVRLPTGGKLHTPYGTSGLAVASALCHLSQSQLAVLEPPNEGEKAESPNKTDFRRFLPTFMRRRQR